MLEVGDSVAINIVQHENVSYSLCHLTEVLAALLKEVNKMSPNIAPVSGDKNFHALPFAQI
jgi:hypothetical protein